jgi:hypothetical protein
MDQSDHDFSTSTRTRSNALDSGQKRPNALCREVHAQPGAPVDDGRGLARLKAGGAKLLPLLIQLIRPFERS